jgi:uncharacterized protein (TIGR00251 family)
MADCLIQLRVSPNARTTSFGGRHGAAWRLKLAAPPVDGRANAALLEFLSDALDLPRRAVALQRGTASRDKWVRISGMDLPQVLEKLGLVP